MGRHDVPGMDDTNFDLSQTLTCPSGNRSVPTTPVPIISVTEASPPVAEEQDTETTGTTPQPEVAASESRQSGYGGLSFILCYVVVGVSCF